MTTIDPAMRPQSMGEEIANSVSHGVAFLGAAVAAPFLVASAAHQGGARILLGVSIFAAAMLLLYLASTLYHALPQPRAKRVFRVLDHGGIFLLIAGTYTPFTLAVLQGEWRWALLGIVWALAIVGIVIEATGVRIARLSTGVYLGMGWLAVAALKPLWLELPSGGFFWLLAGGVAYTLGVAFFAARRLRYAHFVWHLFVILGSACHFVAVLRIVA